MADGTGEGEWESNRPVYDRFADPPVGEGIRLEFLRGRLRSFSLERGGEAFGRSYARGGRGRNVLGAVTFGLNRRIGRAPELGELAWATVGLWLGDNRAAGGRHRSRFRFRTTLSGADLYLDGRPWWVGGRLRARPRRRPANRSRTPRPSGGPSRSAR